MEEGGVKVCRQRKQHSEVMHENNRKYGSFKQKGWMCVAETQMRGDSGWSGKSVRRNVILHEVGGGEF